MVRPESGSLSHRNCRGANALRERTGSREGAWARAGKKFRPTLDLSAYRALGVWIHGGGNGQLLNPQFSHGPMSEHDVRIDFEGWRYVELLFRGPDAGDYAKYDWPYPEHRRNARPLL